MSIPDKLLEVLSDGEPHTRKELLLCIDPEGYATLENLRCHISSLRKQLAHRGQIIANHKVGGGIFQYQLLRHLHSSSDGYR